MKPYYFQALKYLHELRDAVINGKNTIEIAELHKLENLILSKIEESQPYAEISKGPSPQFLDEFISFIEQAGLKENSRKEALKFMELYHGKPQTDMPENSIDSSDKKITSTKNKTSIGTNNNPSNSYSSVIDHRIKATNIITHKIEGKSTPQSNSTKESLPKVASPQKSPVGEGISNFFNQLWNNFREELTINWFLFLGAFMIFGSGLFYCFTSWSDFGKNYQFIAITGGGVFIFLFELLLSKGMKLKKSPRLFALIFVLFLPIILQIHFNTGLIYYLIGLSLGIPTLISLKNRYFPKLDNSWLASTTFLLLIPPTSYLGAIDSQSILSLLLLSEAIILIWVQYFWQQNNLSTKSNLLPSVISCWFYFCLNFSIFSISALIFTVYAIFVQFLLLSKNHTTKGGFVYGSFIATIFFAAWNQNISVIYGSVGLLLLCLHRMNVDGHKIRITVTLSISMFWIFMAPSFISEQFDVISNLSGEILALVYFIYFTNKWDYKFSNRLLLIYSLISFPAFIQSSVLLCLHWVLILVGTYYRTGHKTDEDRLIQGLFLSGALIPALNWCDCRIGLISALWIAVCIFGKSRLESIKPYTILALGFLVVSTANLAFTSGNVPEFYLSMASHALMAWFMLFILPTKIAFIICLTLWQVPIISLAEYLALQTTNFDSNFYWLTGFGLALLIMHPYLLKKLKIIPVDQIDDAKIIEQRVRQGLCLLLIPTAKLILEEPSVGLIFLTLFASYRFPLMVWTLLSFNVLNFMNSNTITTNASIELFPHILLVVFHLLIVELKLFKGSLKFLQKWNRLFTLINLGILLTLSLLNLNMLLPNRIYLYIFTLLVSLIISLRWGLSLGICILPLAQLGLQLHYHDHSVFWNTFILLAGVQYLALNHLFFKDNLKSVCNLDSSFFGINQFLLFSLFSQIIVFKTIELSTLYLCIIPLISYFFISPAKSKFYFYSLMLLIVHYATVQFDWWGLIFVGLPLIVRNWKVRGCFFIWKASLPLMVVSVLIYALNDSPVGLIISLTCFASYMLIEAYLEQREIFVYSAFVSIGLIFVTAKAYGFIGSHEFTSYVLLGLAFSLYNAAPKLVKKWSIYSQPMIHISQILPLISILLEVMKILTFLNNGLPQELVFSLGNLTLLLLLTAYLFQQESFVYSAFVSIGLMYLIAQVHNLIGSHGFTSYMLLGLSFGLYRAAPKLMNKWSVYSQPLIQMSRILPIISILLEVIRAFSFFNNSSPIELITSLSSLTALFLINAYLFQREIFVHFAFISLGFMFASAKIYGLIGSLGFSNYVLLAISICFYYIAPKFRGKWGVFSRPMLILARILPVITVIIEANGSDSPLIYIISGVFYQFIQDDSKLSYYRLGSLMAFNLAIYSVVEPTDLTFQIIPVCAGFSILWYAHSLDENIHKDILKILKFFGNICFYSGALFDFVNQISLRYLIFCWALCGLGGWLALILRARLQLLFAASVFVLTLMGFVIKQLILEVSTGIPLIAGIGFLLVFIAIFLEKFKDTWKAVASQIKSKLKDWKD